MPAASFIIPIRKLDAGGFSRLAKFAREFTDELRQEDSQEGPLELPSAGGDTLCEFLIVKPRHNALRISQGANAGFVIRQLDVPRWTLESALEFGIRSAMANVIAACGLRHLPAPQKLLEMRSRLSRADFIAGRRRASRASKLLNAALQLPRRAILGVQRRDPDFLCWMALREAVAGLRWRAGMHRFFAEHVMARGYRVAEIRVTDDPVFVPPRIEWRAPTNLFRVWGTARASKRSAVSDEKQTTRQPANLSAAAPPPANETGWPRDRRNAA